MSHQETNPHFIRPLQQHEGQQSQPPPPSPAVKQRAGPVESPYELRNQQNQPPLPRGVRPQGQRSKPRGPRGGGYEGDVPFQAPWKDSALRQPQQPQHLPTDSRHDTEYHSPWLIPSQHPTPKEEHQAPDPKRDGEHRSPWMLLPQRQDQGLQENQLTRKKPENLQEPDHTLGTLPQHHDHDRDLEQDHYPLHPRESKPPSKLTRKKPQRQRSQQPDGTLVTQPKLRDPDREQNHYPLRRDSKPSPGQDRSRRSQVPPSQRTGPLTWLIAAFCAIFWIVVFLGGLIVLILYLVYRPRSPKFEVSSATLNAAYVDAGALLNADISILTNFTNPNKKASVEFGHMIIDLYYGNTLIATQYIESFSVANAHSMFANVPMVTSQVRLPLGEITRLQEETNRNAIMLNVKGVFRVRSNLGSFFRYSYRLYSHCTIMMSAPPSGVLRATRCKTKR